MSEHLLILVSTVLANNFVLVRFLGLCPFMGVSNKLEGAMGMAVATAFVLTLSSVSSYLLHQYLLKPLQLEYLSTLSFILVIAVTVQLTEMFMRKSSPVLYRVLGIFLPLITSNCAVLGVALLMSRNNITCCSQPCTGSVPRQVLESCWSYLPLCVSVSPWPMCLCRLKVCQLV